MKLNIKYFGLIAEITGSNEEILNFSGSTLYELLDDIYEKYPDLKTKDFQIAKNHEIVTGNSIISDEEIAFLPPFSGG